MGVFTRRPFPFHTGSSRRGWQAPASTRRAAGRGRPKALGGHLIGDREPSQGAQMEISHGACEARLLTKQGRRGGHRGPRHHRHPDGDRGTSHSPNQQLPNN